MQALTDVCNDKLSAKFQRVSVMHVLCPIVPSSITQGACLVNCTIEPEYSELQSVFQTPGQFSLN